MSRPAIERALLERLRAAAPGRVRDRLAREPAQAEGWAWAAAGDATTVTTPGGEVVTLRGATLAGDDQVGCSCLLAPRCLHLLAVATRLDVGGLELAPPAALVPSAREEDDEERRAPLTRAQRDACAAFQRAAAELVASGAHRVEPALHAELLRALHACRVTGLHRPARAAQRLAHALRDGTAATVDPRALSADVGEALETCALLLREGPAEPERVGAGRRRYAPAPELELAGLLAEAIDDRSGYAGVAVTLIDAGGRAWSLSDVRPGTSAERVDAAYCLDQPMVGPLRALARSRLRLVGATASADGRLGGLAAAHATRGGACAWTEPPLARRWAEPLEDQLERAWTALERARPRPDGGLLFLEGVVRGASEDALWLDVAGVPWQCEAPSGAAALASANLRLLACAPGLALRAVGRLLPSRPRAVALLAVGPLTADHGATAVAPATAGVDPAAAVDPAEGVDELDEDALDAGAPALLLPQGWGGRCFLGLDRLSASFVSPRAPAPRWCEGGPDDPAAALEPLTRRLTLVLLAGRDALACGAAADLERDAVALERRLLRRGAALLRELGAAARADDRTFAAAWMRLRRYAVAATRRLWRPPVRVEA